MDTCLSENLEHFLPRVERQRKEGPPFFGLVPLYEYRYKPNITPSSLAYLSGRPFPETKTLVRKRKELETLVNEELHELFASGRFSLSFADYFQGRGVLLWHLHAIGACGWRTLFSKSYPEVAVELTASHDSEAYRDDHLHVKAQFRIARSHDVLLIPTCGAGSACYLDDCVALKAPDLLRRLSEERDSFVKLQLYLKFLREHVALVFFPSTSQRRELFDRIRGRAVAVRAFTKPTL